MTTNSTTNTNNTNRSNDTNNTNNTNRSNDDPGSSVPTDPDTGMPDPGQIQTDALKGMGAMMAAQSAIQIAGMGAQLVTAGLNIAGQTVGATTAMAVQSVTDLVKTTKDAVKAQGEAFQKAN